MAHTLLSPSCYISLLPQMTEFHFFWVGFTSFNFSLRATYPSTPGLMTIGSLSVLLKYSSSDFRSQFSNEKNSCEGFMGRAGYVPAWLKQSHTRILFIPALSRMPADSVAEHGWYKVPGGINQFALH